MADGPAAPGNDNHPSMDVQVEFELDEHGRVWMIRDGDCMIIGRKDGICDEMKRFLADIDNRKSES